MKLKHLLGATAVCSKQTPELNVLLRTGQKDSLKIQSISRNNLCQVEKLKEPKGVPTESGSSFGKILPAQTIQDTAFLRTLSNTGVGGVLETEVWGMCASCTASSIFCFFEQKGQNLSMTFYSFWE